MKFAKRLLSVSICLSILMFSLTTEASRGKTYTVRLAPSIQGEYNITIKAYCTSSPVLYKKNILGKLTRASGYKITRLNGNYIIKAGLLKSNYYVQFACVGTYSVSYCKNLDVYSSSYSKVTKGLQWKPTSTTLSPSSIKAYTQVAYLTNLEAALYSLNLSRSVYLKLLDETITVSAAILSGGASASSGALAALSKASRSTVVVAARHILSVCGYSIPTLSSVVQSGIKNKTHNFSDGLKITVYITNYGTYQNVYDSWNQKANTVKGISGCRGNFSTCRKVLSWY